MEQKSDNSKAVRDILGKSLQDIVIHKKARWEIAERYHCALFKIWQPTFNYSPLLTDCLFLVWYAHEEGVETSYAEIMYFYECFFENRYYNENEKTIYIEKNREKYQGREFTVLIYPTDDSEDVFKSLKQAIYDILIKKRSHPEIAKLRCLSIAEEYDSFPCLDWNVEYDKLLAECFFALLHRDEKHCEITYTEVLYYYECFFEGREYSTEDRDAYIFANKEKTNALGFVD